MRSIPCLSLPFWWKQQQQEEGDKLHTSERKDILVVSTPPSKNEGNGNRPHRLNLIDVRSPATILAQKHRWRVCSHHHDDNGEENQDTVEEKAQEHQQELRHDVPELTVVWIPWTELSTRSFELPPPRQISSSDTTLAVLMESYFMNEYPPDSGSPPFVDDEEKRRPGVGSLNASWHQAIQAVQQILGVTLDLNTSSINSCIDLAHLDSDSATKSCSTSDTTDDTSMSGFRRRRRSQSPQGWNVSLWLDSDDLDTWQQARAWGWISDAQASDCPLEPTWPPPRLWEPNPMVQHVVVPLLIQHLQQQQHQQQLQQLQGDQKAPQTSGSGEITCHEIWDLGCGIGRDVAYVAEQLLSLQLSRRQSIKSPLAEFRVVGWDQRYRSGSAKAVVVKNPEQDTLQFWQRQGVQGVTTCRYFDFNQVDKFLEILQGMNTTSHAESGEGHENTLACGPPTRVISRVACIYAVRFWHRPLFEQLAQQPHLLSSGTLLAISHFAHMDDGQEPGLATAWNFDHPHPRHVLQRSELASIFSSDKDAWTIMHNQVVHEQVGDPLSRTLVEFVVRRN